MSNPNHGRGIYKPPTAIVSTGVDCGVLKELDRIARAERVSRSKVIRDAVVAEVARRREESTDASSP